MKRVLSSMALAALALVAIWACNSSKDEEPYRECIEDSDCGVGYVCEYQECKRVIVDGDTPVDGDADGDIPVDGDVDEAEDGDVEPDVDGDVPDGDLNDGDVDGDADPDNDGDSDEEVACDATHLDPRCNDFFSEIYCRNNQVQHSVLECRSDAEGDRLYRCNLVLNCEYPDCGYVTYDTLIKSCTDGCVAAEDMEQDDYCAEDGPADGDTDLDGDADDDSVDVDYDGGDFDPIQHQDGYLCSTNDNCLPGHYCRADWDGSGKYCVRDGYVCPYHVNIEEGQPAVFYEQGDRICVGNSYKRCSQGAWIAPVVCPPAECIDGIQKEAQTCENGESGVDASCQPDPRVIYACPGNFMCLDDTGFCRSSCTFSEECRAGYSCNSEGDCVFTGK